MVPLHLREFGTRKSGITKVQYQMGLNLMGSVSDSSVSDRFGIR
jgi:hypothetical protein